MTTIQLTYRLYQGALLMWLAGLNTRHLKTVNLPLVAAVMAGLLWTRGRASCLAMAMGGAFTHDALTRLLNGQSLRAVLETAALTLVERMGGYLVLDDVVWEKRGKLIAGVTKLFMSSESRYISGLNAVVLVWTDGKGLRVPLTFRFWKKPKWQTKKGHSWYAFDDTRHQTKNELAVELLDWAYQKGFKPTAVLFDAAYPSRQMLKYLKHRKWQWVSRLKGNRALKVGGKKFSLDQWEEEAVAGRAPALGKSVPAMLTDWGQVRVIATRVKEDGSLRFLVGSNPNWGRGRIEAMYGHRWCIETLFRDGKQLAGLGDCQCRGWQAQQNHFALALLALAFIAHQAGRSESSGSALGRIVNRAITLVAAPVPAKVRPIKLARRKKRGKTGQKAHTIRSSGRAA
jgi:SRSO17 transposase